MLTAMLVAFTSPAPPLFIALGGGYLLAGGAVAVGLVRRGEPRANVLLSLVTWPLLLPLLWDAAPTSTGGPLTRRIDDALDALAATLGDPSAGELPGGDDVGFLREALHRADSRVALVDRLLDSPDAASAPDAQATLRTARATAVAEIEAVITGVIELRLQVGLLALHGDTGPVRERLRELRGRIGAFDEVARAVPALSSGA